MLNYPYSRKLKGGLGRDGEQGEEEGDDRLDEQLLLQRQRRAAGVNALGSSGSFLDDADSNSKLNTSSRNAENTLLACLLGIGGGIRPGLSSENVTNFDQEQIDRLYDLVLEAKEASTMIWGSSRFQDRNHLDSGVGRSKDVCWMKDEGTNEMMKPPGSRIVRVPCRADWMPTDPNSEVCTNSRHHNLCGHFSHVIFSLSQTAFFCIPENAKHGEELTYFGCSYPGAKFRYCSHCKLPCANHCFSTRHNHGDIDYMDVATAATVATPTFKQNIPYRMPTSALTPRDVQGMINTPGLERIDDVATGKEKHQPVTSESPFRLGTKLAYFSDDDSISAVDDLTSTEEIEDRCAALSARNESIKKYIRLKKEELSLKRQLQSLKNEMNDQDE